MNKEHVSGSTVLLCPRSRHSEGRKGAQKSEQIGFEDQKPAVCPAADKGGKPLARGWDQIPLQLMVPNSCISLNRLAYVGMHCKYLFRII